MLDVDWRDSCRAGAAVTKYGRQAIHVHPGLSWNAIASASRDYSGSVIDGRQFVFTSSGRMGIVHALRAWGVSSGDEVLVPAYHCLAMSTPLEWMGVVARFYPLREDLSPDLAAVRSMLTKRTRAILAVHYFGFERQLSALRAECDWWNIALIEDCAHAFYTIGQDGHPVGGVGDYAIASPMKFLPTFDGGVLVTRFGSPIAEIVHKTSSFKYELKAVVDVLDRAAITSSLRGGSSMLLLAARVRRKFGGVKGINVPAAVEGGFEFDSEWLGREPACISKAIISMARRSCIAGIRRANYAYLVERLHGARGIRLLYPTLERGTVPYALPILADDGERVFQAARSAAIQVFRWEFTETQPCQVTSSYARSLLQFPCHQAMGLREMNRIIHLLTSECSGYVRSGDRRG